MLLFKPEHVILILLDLEKFNFKELGYETKPNKKTQTRRIWKKCRVNIDAIHLAKTEMISKRFFAKLRIIDRWEERFGDITLEDVKKEGYNTIPEFFEVFFTINKIKTDEEKEAWKNRLVWVVEFEVEESNYANYLAYAKSESEGIQA